MKYEKPNVALIASAVETIKGGKNGDNQVDNFTPPFTINTTLGAYQADE